MASELPDLWDEGAVQKWVSDEVISAFAIASGIPERMLRPPEAVLVAREPVDFEAFAYAWKKAMQDAPPMPIEVVEDEQ